MVREQRFTSAGDYGSNTYRLDGLVKKLKGMEPDFDEERKERRARSFFRSIPSGRPSGMLWFPIAGSDRRNKDSLARRSISKPDPGRVKRKIPTSYCKAAPMAKGPPSYGRKKHMGGKNGRIAPAIRGVAVSCVKRLYCRVRGRGEKRASGAKTGPNRLTGRRSKAGANGLTM